MELFNRLFQDLLWFLYHCCDQALIQEYLADLLRREQAVYFFLKVVGESILGKEVLSRRKRQYQAWPGPRNFVFKRHFPVYKISEHSCRWCSQPYRLSPQPTTLDESSRSVGMRSRPLHPIDSPQGQLKLPLYQLNPRHAPRAKWRTPPSTKSLRLEQFCA